MEILRATDLRKRYSGGNMEVEALKGVSLSLSYGEFVTLMGPSGCGKSSLLHLCGAMDRPTSGTVVLEGLELERLTDDQLTRVRRERIGFVFQFFNLLPTLTVMENVRLPLLLAGMPPREAATNASRQIETLGLQDRISHFPNQLSGGEMQRVAIARAVVHQPSLLVADEPTGNLDSSNGRKILDLLRSLCEEHGISVLLATHSEEIASQGNRVLHLRDGTLEPQTLPD